MNEAIICNGLSITNYYIQAVVQSLCGIGSWGSGRGGDFG